MFWMWNSIIIFFFLGIEIHVYIYVLDSARLLFEHPVLQYKAIFARIFLYIACGGSLCGIFWLEDLGRLIVCAASTGIFWL